jgi:streptogramin lyase
MIVNKQVTFHYVDLGIQSSDIDYCRIRSIVEEASGVLWITTGHELYRRFLDGKIERVELRTGLPNANFMSLVKESERQLWLGTRSGLWSISQVSSADFAENSFEVKQYAIKEGLPCVEVNALFRDSGGKLWVGTDCGLYEFLKDEKRFRLRLDNRQFVRIQILGLERFDAVQRSLAGGALVSESRR